MDSADQRVIDGEYAAKYEALRDAVRIALPYLQVGPFRSEDYDDQDCRRVHIDFMAGIAQARGFLEEKADLRVNLSDPPRRKIVYAATFVDSLAELTGQDKRHVRDRLRERGEVQGDLQPVDPASTEADAMRHREERHG